MRTMDGGVKNESNGWEEWRMTAMDGKGGE